MAFTYTVNETFINTPSATDPPEDTHDYIKQGKVGFRERLEVEHEWDIGGTQADHGLHKQGSMHPYFQESAPGNHVDGNVFVDSDTFGVQVSDGTSWHRAFYDETNEQYEFSKKTDVAIDDITADSLYVVGTLLADYVRTDYLDFENGVTYEATGDGDSVKYAFKRVEFTWDMSSETKTVDVGVANANVLCVWGGVGSGSVYPCGSKYVWFDDTYTGGTSVRLEQSGLSGTYDGYVVVLYEV